MSTLWKALYQKDPKLFPKGPECMTSNTSLMDQPKVQITYHDVDEGALQFSSIPGNLLNWTSAINIIFSFRSLSVQSSG